MKSIEASRSGKLLGRLTMATALAVLGISMASSVAAAFPPPPDDPTMPQAKVTICHVTPGNIVVNEPAADGDVGGHAGHPNDIIPPFWFEDPSDPQNSPKRFPGLNWDAAGQAIFANDCEEVVPTTAAPTTAAPTTAAPTTAAPTTAAPTTAAPTTAAPPTTRGATTTTTVVTPTTGPTSTLPPTGGGSNANLIGAATLLVLGGGVALAAARRRAA